MIILFILLFASVFTGCVFGVRQIVKNKEVTVLSVTSILNVLFFLLIFIFAK